MNTPAPKPVIWMGDSLARLQACPPTVQDEIGYAIYLAQIGEKHPRAKPLKELGSGVLDVDQPKVSALRRGRLWGFSLDHLVRFLVLLDHDVDIVVKKRSRPGVPARLLIA